MLPRRNRAADLSRLHREQFAYHGEPLTLPDGREVTAVPRAGWEPVQAARSYGEANTPLEIRHQDRPQVLLFTRDAAALRERDAVHWRGARYFAAKLDPDGDPPEAGLTRVELMRATERNDETEGAVWR